MRVALKGLPDLAANDLGENRFCFALCQLSPSAEVIMPKWVCAW